MFEKKNRMVLSHDEQLIMIMALNDLRNKLIAEERYTDAVDELILKVYSA